MGSKTEQDVYLQSLMEIASVERERPRGESSKPREFNIRYHILHNGKRTRVCKKAFIQTYSCSPKRCYRLSHLLKNNTTPTDKRGKNVSGNAIPGSVISKIRDHIESYPRKKEHYTGKDKEFLAANLNIKLIYSMFVEKERNFLLETLGDEKRLSYKFFWQYFKENYDFGFGRPVKDACVTCEELNNKIKNPLLNDNAKKAAVAELMVHKRRSKKFYNSLNETKKICEDDKKTIGISIDFMANVSLPCIPVQDLYYFRQLTLNVFGIHNLSTREMTCFVYHEGEGGKGANDVCSMIQWYINNKIDMDIVETLYIFADNCTGQNKNNTLIRYLMGLCEKSLFKEVKLIFPVRGHSFMPNDRDFGIIRRKLRKQERYYTVKEVINLIMSSSQKKNKFNVKCMKREDFVDYNTWWPKFYKKTCLSEDSYGKNVPKDKKVTFALTKYQEFRFNKNNPRTVECMVTIGGIRADSFNLRNTQVNLELPKEPAYNGKLPINALKMEDIRKTLVYITEENKQFWEEILLYPIKND